MNAILKKARLLAILVPLRVFGQSVPDIVPYLASNNVTWTTPGPGSSQSMPLGNGDIGLNVWVETNGAVDLYVGKSDSWGDNVQGDQGLLKIGGARITLNPNPLVQGAPFSQVLMLHEGEIQITEGSGANAVVLLIWVDANNPVVRIEATSAGTPVNMQASLIDWRLSGSNPDTILTGQTNYIGWHHRNSSTDDPHIANWTCGAIIQGAGFTNLNTTNLASAPALYQVLSIFPLTTRTQSASQWLTQLQSNINQMAALDLGTMRAAHQAWWDAFWHRSWIYVNGDQDATNITSGYVLQRFITACAARGAYPAKFNGSLFVVDNPSVPYTADGRRWGGQYWFQNTRLIYWPMLESGDFDMMLALFNMYAKMLPANEAQITNFYGHGGVYFAETSPFWGGLSYEGPDAPANFTAHYFEGVLELSMMMLDYYDFTGDTAFLTNTLIPVASAGLDFYDQHFSLDGGGKMLLDPVNAIETYWKVHDPAPDIAGLTAVLPRMLALPANFITSPSQAKWTRMLSEIPPLPTGSNGGATVLLPYTGPQTAQFKNGENPELYAIFPYRVYGLDKSNLSLAVATFNARKFSGLGWADWMQDPIQAAMIGLTGVARQYTVYNMTNTEPSLRFPAFWREQNDYMPSQDTGGVAEDALQKMIMQTDGSKIMLLPAWPSEWNAIFKLNAPYNTTVQGTITNGTVTDLIVTPSSRQADVILMNGTGTAPATPASLTATGANTQVTLTWTASPTAISYNIKRSTISGGNYSIVASGVTSTNYTDTNLADGTTYYYVISATNSSGQSGNSSEVSVTPILAVPNPPAGLVASTGDAQVILNWTASPGATTYNVKRSTTNGGPYAVIANNVTSASYTNSGLANGTNYFFVVSAQNNLGTSSDSIQASAMPSGSASHVTFASGIFTSDSVLLLAGTPAEELYGVGFGNASGGTTANGYVFGGYPGTNVSYGGSNAYAVGGFLNAATSHDSVFDSVLDNAELGVNNGVLILSNLTSGASYSVLFLEADTRIGMGTRTFNLSSGGSFSPAQPYAYAGGSPYLGAYILCTFVAAGTTQAFTNAQSLYGYQLNSVLVEKMGTGFTSGTFTNNSVLAFAGTPAQELYGVSLGDATSRTTANGYVFSRYPSTNLSYGGPNAYGVSVFLGGGGTSGDASFDAVLNNGELGINSGTLVLSNLTVGATYNVLFLESDTRSGMGTRTYSISCGSVASPSQTYAFQAGTTSLGGYILCTFVATGTTQTFANNQGSYGYQLGGVLVERVAAAPYRVGVKDVNINQTSLTMSGGTGPPGGSYRILSSTNLAAHLATWTPVATNYFDVTGGFYFANPVTTGIPAMFYQLVSP